MHTSEGFRFKSSFSQNDAVPVKLRNNNNFSIFDIYKCWVLKE